MLGPYDPTQEINVLDPPVPPAGVQPIIPKVTATGLCNAAGLTGYPLASCIFDVIGTGDASLVEASRSVIDLTNPPGPPDPCKNPALIVDGVFDDAWNCVKPAKGTYTFAYFIYVEGQGSPMDGFLYILNDWYGMT